MIRQRWQWWWWMDDVTPFKSTEILLLSWSPHLPVWPKMHPKVEEAKSGQAYLPSFPPQECLLPSCECLFVITGQCPPARLFSCQHILNFLKPCQLGFEAEKILRCVSLKCFIVFPQEGQTTHPPLTQLWREMHFSTSFRSWASVKSAKFGWKRKLRIYVCWKLEGGKLSKWKTNIFFLDEVTLQWISIWLQEHDKNGPTTEKNLVFFFCEENSQFFFEIVFEHHLTHVLSSVFIKGISGYNRVLTCFLLCYRF